MNNAERTEPKHNWHTAFYAAIQAELVDYLDVLEFSQEHILNDQPLRMDVLIIKQKQNVKINKNIASHFKAHNIIEYKSPKKSLNMRDYIKTIGYACLYQAIARVDYKKITITYVCTRNPVKLLNALKDNPLHQVTQPRPGIYDIQGDRFPIRIIESKSLTSEDSIWIKNLNENVEINQAEQVFNQYNSINRKIHLAAYLQVFMEANEKRIKELIDMGQARKGKRNVLDELIVELGMHVKYLTEGKAEGEAKGKAEGKAEGTAQTKNTMLTVFKCFMANDPIDQIAVKTNLSVEELEQMKQELQLT